MRDPAVLCKNTWVLINNETKIQWTVEFVQLESNFQNKLTSLADLGSQESVSQLNQTILGDNSHGYYQFNMNLFLFNFHHHSLLHCSFEIFFLDSVGLGHVLASEPVSALPVVLALQSELLQFWCRRGGETQPGSGQPAWGHETGVPRINIIQARALVREQEAVLMLELRSWRMSVTLK